MFNTAIELTCLCQNLEKGATFWLLLTNLSTATIFRLRMERSASSAILTASPLSETDKNIFTAIESIRRSTGQLFITVDEVCLVKVSRDEADEKVHCGDAFV